MIHELDLAAIGLLELNTDWQQSYERLAIELAPARLRDIRARWKSFGWCGADDDRRL